MVSEAEFLLGRLALSLNMPVAMDGPSAPFRGPCDTCTAPTWFCPQPAVPTRIVHPAGHRRQASPRRCARLRPERRPLRRGLAWLQRSSRATRAMMLMRLPNAAAWPCRRLLVLLVLLALVPARLAAHHARLYPKTRGADVRIFVGWVGGCASYYIYLPLRPGERSRPRPLLACRYRTAVNARWRAPHRPPAHACSCLFDFTKLGATDGGFPSPNNNAARTKHAGRPPFRCKRAPWGRLICGERGRPESIFGPPAGPGPGKSQSGPQQNAKARAVLRPF